MHAGVGAEAAAGQAQAAEALAGVEGGPESEEGSEGKGEIDAIGRGDAGGVEDAGPVVEQMAPTLRGVEPAQGVPERAAGLVEARVGAGRKRQVGAVRRVGVLVRDQFRFGGERRLGEEFGEGFLVVAGAGGGEPGGLERVGGNDGGNQPAEAAELPGLEGFGHRGSACEMTGLDGGAEAGR